MSIIDNNGFMMYGCYNKANSIVHLRYNDNLPGVYDFVAGCAVNRNGHQKVPTEKSERD